LEFPFIDYSHQRILSSSDHVVFCSQTTLRELSTYKKIDVDRSSVIYNGVDLDEVEGVKESQVEESEDISIIFAGRLFYAKGILLLLEAFNRIKDARNIRLNIFGKGPMQHQISKFILSHGLKDKVSCRGYVPHMSLIREMQKSDILVLPSLCEAQPMIILEAMACSKPVVAFDLPFSREIISNMNNGVLAEAYDVGSLSEKIELLASDERLRRRIGRAGYDHVRKNHSWDIQIDKYLKVYEEVSSCT
jgi:glycosyltransferase involved in cell wall biosynthesis